MKLSGMEDIDIISEIMWEECEQCLPLSRALYKKYFDKVAKCGYFLYDR